MSEHLTPDPLAELLGPPALPADGRLRDDLRERTARLLRRRRWLRRLAWAASLAACYAAGAATPRRQPPSPVPQVVHHAVPKSAPTHEDARALECKAFDRTDGRANLYLKAGDHYLEEESDLQSALRCYGAALDEGAGTAVSADDSWLLMTIKDAREKENRRAKNGN